MMYTLVIFILGNQGIPATMTTIPGFTTYKSCSDTGTSLIAPQRFSNKLLAVQGLSITWECIGVK